MKHYNPAAMIIRMLGGVKACAHAAGTSLSTVQRWRAPTYKGGSGGYIPSKHYKRLQKAALRRDIVLPIAAFVDINVARQAREEAGDKDLFSPD